MNKEKLPQAKAYTKHNLCRNHLRYTSIRCKSSRIKQGTMTAKLVLDDAIVIPELKNRVLKKVFYRYLCHRQNSFLCYRCANFHHAPLKDLSKYSQHVISIKDLIAGYYDDGENSYELFCNSMTLDRYKEKGLVKIPGFLTRNAKSKWPCDFCKPRIDDK